MATSTTDTNMKSKNLDRQDGGARDEVVRKGGVGTGTGIRARAGNGTGPSGRGGSPLGGGITGYFDSDVDEADYEAHGQLSRFWVRT